MPLGHLYVFFGEMSIQILCSFLIGWLDFWILSLMSCLQIFETNLVSCIVCEYFLPVCGLFFQFSLWFPLPCKSFQFNQIQFVYFCFPLTFYFISITLGDRLKKILLQFTSKRVLPMFSSKSFMVSGITFRSVIYFELVFVYGVKECSSFTSLRVAVQFSEHHFPRRLIFSPLYSVTFFCHKLICYRCMGLFVGFLSYSIALSILLHWSLFLFLHQNHIVLMTVILQYSLRSGSLIPLTPFFFLEMVLAI